jgi:hypothetical protein
MLFVLVWFVGETPPLTLFRLGGLTLSWISSSFDFGGFVQALIFPRGRSLYFLFFPSLDLRRILMFGGSSNIIEIKKKIRSIED